MIDIKKALARFNLIETHPGSYDAQNGWNNNNEGHFTKTCPADNELVGTIGNSTAKDYDNVIKTAVDTQKTWRMVPAPKRGELIKRIGDLVAENMEDLAIIVMLDTGKSLMEAKGELQEVVDMSTLAAGQARMMYGFTQQSQRSKHRMYDQWLPLGVIGIITAYNFPAAVWAQNGFLSAIGGNTVIWKPSPKVPLTAIAMQQIAIQAEKELGYNGVFSLYMPVENELAELVVKDQRVSMISFTGSTGIGHKVAETISETLGRRYMLECSGNNGCIVDETADLKLAAKAITFGAVGTTGQRCTSTRRLIVHKDVVDDLIPLLKDAFSQIVVGDPRDASTVVGPLIDEAAVTSYKATIADAEKLGGQVVYGGNVIDRPGLYVEPTLITNVEPDWSCVQNETFAPIVFIMTYTDLEDAIRIHNDVPQGLASGIHSTNLTNIETFLSAQGSDCGIVRVNMGTTGADVGAAFGGEKETGGGRTAGSDAWKGYMRRQSVCINWGGESAWDSRISL